jgi:spore germination protein KC
MGVERTMKKKMCKTIKRFGAFLLLLLLTLALCGCTHDMSRKEIDEINMVLVLGIDYSGGEYNLTALYNTGGGADPEKGGGAGTEEIAEGKGKTAYEALEDLKLKNKKAVTLAQTGSFMIGEGAAEHGLDKSIDFLSRDETIKMEALVYVIKEQSASDFIKGGIENEQTIHEDMEAIKQKQQEVLTRNDNSMVNILNDVRQTFSSVLIPYLIADKSGYLIEGYAVFDQLKLRDYLDHETSDGVNFIRNIMRSYPIYLSDKVGLYVSFTNTKLKAHLKNKEITVTIKVNFETMIKEVSTQENIFKTDNLLALTSEQNDYIKKILEKAVDYSTNTGLDILNLARIVENQNYEEWKNVKEDWPKLISNIKYEYMLQSRISKTFILGNEE